MTSLRLALGFLVLPLVKIFPVGCVVLFLAVRGFRAADAGLVVVGVGIESTGLVFDFGTVSVEVLLPFLAAPG
jgi:EamA domain-containing membrane protein RarD